MPRDLDRVKLADNLFFNLLDRERGFYAGGRKVPYGSIVTLTRSGARRHDWYDPGTIPPVRFKHDQDYVDKANALLAEATGKALAMSRKPAISLSGGLDSPLIADEVLRQLPVGAQLHSFTAVPDPDWDGITQPGSMGDERHFVARFSAEKPQLVAHFTANPGTGFDARWDEFFVAMGGAPNHLVNYQAYHGVWAGAQEAGCDAVLTGEFGNETYSNDGRWAYVEYLLKLRWKELALALKHRPGDKRSLLRKVAAMSVLRIMPRPVRRMVRAIRHAGATDLNRLVSMLPPAAARRAMRRAMAGGAVIDREWVASQQASNRMDYIWRDAHCGDVEQAFEQIYGLRWIDVSTYRPLVEFCMGLPTDQFVRGGVDRWLARRMAAGRLPEAQRSNRLLGWHNPDWHVRMTRRLPELRAKVLAMAADPELAGLLDTSRMAALLDDWPAETPLEMERWMPRAAGLTRGFLTARFVQHVSGRNRP